MIISGAPAKEWTVVAMAGNTIRCATVGAHGIKKQDGGTLTRGTALVTTKLEELLDIGTFIRGDYVRIQGIFKVDDDERGRPTLVPEPGTASAFSVERPAAAAEASAAAERALLAQVLDAV